MLKMFHIPTQDNKNGLEVVIVHFVDNVYHLNFVIYK
jgi:hypothetical protein